MAGEWIKFDTSTPDKPEVMRSARKLGVDRDLIIGKLVKLWSWFDTNSVDGRVDGVVSTDVDSLVGIAGFCSVMQEVGWLEFDDDSEVIILPNFDRHNGETAKKRALKNKRQARWRQNRDESVAGDVDGEASTGASTREEKRREEEKNPPIDPPKSKTVQAMPADFVLTDLMLAYAKNKAPGIDPAHQFEKFKNHHAAKGTKFKDWSAAWRNWVLNAAKWEKPEVMPRPTKSMYEIMGEG